MYSRIPVALLAAASLTLIACEQKKPATPAPAPVKPSAAAPAEKPVTPSEKPAEKTADVKPTEPASAEKSAEKPPEKPVEQPAEKQAENPAPITPPTTPPDVKPSEPAPAESKPATTPPAENAPVTPPAPGKPVELSGGLIVEDLVVGTGPAVPVGGAVVVHYKGTLKSDGTEFDSSYKRGQPAAFPLANLIKGWQEGIPGMKVGGKRKLTVPYAMAYGENGRPPVIPAKADLVFEIELVNFVKVEDLKVGDGPECKPNQTVRVYYKGTFTNGKEFESNVGQEPIEFGLDEVIPGWTVGIPGMKVGGKRKLTIPYQFAYGDRGSPPTIPPKSDLVFEIDLVGVR